MNPRSLLAICFASVLFLAGCRSVPPTPEDPGPLLTFDDTVTLDNGLARLGVAPSVGRVVHFGLADGANLLWINTVGGAAKTAAGHDGHAYVNAGGDKTWATVQFIWPRAYDVVDKLWPPDGTIDGSPWNLVEHTDRRIVIESQVSPEFGLAVRRSFTLAPDRPRVEIVNTYLRVEPNPYPATIWSVTQVRPPRVALLGVADDRPAGQPAWRYLTTETPDRTAGQIEPDEAAGVVRWRGLPGEGAKIGGFGRWVAAVYDDVTFLQAAAYDPAAAYPDGSNAQLYRARTYIELELLSPTVHLRPGATLEHRVVWRLIETPPAQAEAQVRATLPELLDESQPPGLGLRGPCGLPGAVKGRADPVDRTGMRVPPPQHGQDPRRRMPRHTTDVVTCPLGEVVDLSGTGVRVAVAGRCPLKVGQAVNLPLQTPNGRMTLASRVVWRKRAGLLGGCVLGLDFVGIKPNQSVVLATIARFGFVAASDVKSARGSSAAAADGPQRIEADLAMAPYFEKLELTPEASAEQVKDAYRKLARQYHPDVAPGPENQAKFVELREAYQLLSDHLRRAG
ncbi:MAG: DUF4380 domain-containing protein [Planctomycetota bacterium]